ncbi:MAG: nucleoside 2-deoxyribosyltransferase [Planctomycetota bacterium]
MADDTLHRIYLAAPLFSQGEREWNRAFAAALTEAAPGLAVTLPQDFRIGGRYNDPRHFDELFRRCLGAIAESDAVVAVLDGADTDSGVAVEIGYAYAAHIPVVGLRTDYRDNQDRGVNLMVAQACRQILREYAFQEDVVQLAGSVARRLRKVLAPRPPA